MANTHVLVDASICLECLRRNRKNGFGFWLESLDLLYASQVRQNPSHFVQRVAPKNNRGRRRTCPYNMSRKSFRDRFGPECERTLIYAHCFRSEISLGQFEGMRILCTHNRTGQARGKKEQLASI